MERAPLLVRTTPPPSSGSGDVNVEDREGGELVSPSALSPASLGITSASDQHAYLRLLPLLLVHMTISTMGLNPINEFVILKASPPNSTFYPSTASLPGYPATSSGSLPDYSTCAADPQVQRSAASWVQGMSLAVAVPTFLLAPLIGMLLDRVGRKPILFLPFVAVLLPALAVLLIRYFDLGLWLLVLADLLKGLLGGNAVFVMTVYSIMADLTTGETRTRVFYLKEAFSLFGFSFGPFLGGLINQRFSLEHVFYTIVATELIVILYAATCIPETLPAHKRRPLHDTTRPLDPLAHLAANLRSLAALLSTRTPTLLALVNAMGALTQSGYVFVFFFIPAKRFGWDSYASGQFLMVGSFCRFAYFAFIVPTVLAWLQRGRDPWGAVGVEIWLIRCGLLTYVVTLTAYGLAWEGWHYYLIIPIYSFASSSLPTLRSLLSKTTPADQQGRLFASLEVLQSFGSLASHVVMPQVFRATVSWAPEAVCYVIAGMWGMALVGTAWVDVGALVVGTENFDEERNESERPIIN
ncbi:major facilitator superfamily domain-containing protein [Chytriomyces sp. MP71]|nr:major facilitator superfamily domain-containing protein [Chytriomyces sp. MP71]